MPKLRKFNKNKNKLNTKNILISFAVIMGIMMATIISKSYAIYKLQQDYDVIKNKIGTYSMGDVRVAVLVDGKETDTFPSYEMNYKVEKIDCTNGVTATFDVENWQINIADMSATSTKCTVSFNSKETNELTPLNYTKTELLALNESLTDDFKSSLKEELLNETYPVGSVYISTTDSSVDDVVKRFGGTWERYATDTTLVGYKEGTNTINATGGSKTVTLATTNLPSHSHVIPSLSVSSWSGSHSHGGNGLYLMNLYGRGTATSFGLVFNNTTNLWWNPNETRTMAETLTVSGQTTNESNTTTCTNCSATPINVQDPYTVVYMYKRTA